MAIKKYSPTSPARRFMTVSTFEEITKFEPERSLLAPLNKTAGRNSYGRITVRHRGGGNKRKYRIRYERIALCARIPLPCIPRRIKICGSAAFFQCDSSRQSRQPKAHSKRYPQYTALQALCAYLRTLLRALRQTLTEAGAIFEVYTQAHG